jgi:hypothetical protein
MKRIKLILSVVFILNIIPILLLFFLNKANFLAGTSLLFIYGILWILKIPLSIYIWKKREMTKYSIIILGLIFLIFLYIQYLNYVFIFQTS